MSWRDSLTDKLTSLSHTEFDYIETNDIHRASELNVSNTGIYMEATVIYFEIKNMQVLLKELGRRKMAQAYTMYREILAALAEQSGNGAFVSCGGPNVLLVIFPGKEETHKDAIVTALKIVTALTETYKPMFADIPGIEFAMGIDHGHILGSKTLSDNNLEHLTWFGLCIHKAAKICQNCSRPFYTGISGIIYHSLDDRMLRTQKRILGIKKNVEIWNKVTYQYENVKKHLYQTNHKLPLDEAPAE